MTKTSLEKQFSTFPETKSFVIFDEQRFSGVSVDLSEIMSIYASIESGEKY
ncbi:hypothetical protein [Bacillus sp. JJ722]|uniref:hypothetical protein n=1 Tax=Bacillus sp. JJ722 TaxID=3122973 RepID=UPI002FFE17BB